MKEDLKHKTKVGLYWTFLNQGAIKVLTFIVGIIMARILSPEDYGIAALPAVFFAIAGIFVNSGFSQALVRKPEVSDKDLSTAFYYSIAMGVFIYAILFFMAPFIAAFFNTPILTSLVRVSALTFLWGPIITPQSVILQRKLDFKTPARISVVTQIIGAIVGVIAAYNGFGLWALIIMTIVSSLLNLIQTWWVVKWVPTERWDKESFKYLWGFGNKMLGVGLIEAVYNNITPIFIGKFYSTKDLGYYNRALGYAQLPSSYISNMVQSVTFPTLSKVQEDNEKLGQSYRKLLRSLSFIVFPLMFLLGALAEPLIVTLLTDKWLKSVLYLRLMCVWWCWVPIHQINGNLLLVKGKSDVVFKLTLFKRAIALTIMFFSLPLGIVPFLIGSIINSLLVLAINTYYTGKFIHVGFIRQMTDVFPILLLAFVSASMAYFVSLLFTNMILQIIIAGSCGLAVYAGVAMALKFPELQEVKYMLKR